MESEHLVSNEIIDYNIIINNMDEVIMYDSDDNSITTIESSNSIDSIDDDNILNSEINRCYQKAFSKY